MRTIKTLLVTMGLTAIACVSVAQEEEAEPEIYTYATYFTCEGGPLSVVDDIIADDAERMDGFVDDGTILRWGWLAHHTGGNWRRIFYYQADSIDALLDAGDAIADTGDDDAEDDDDQADFGDVCGGHDDYIWQVEMGSNNEKRGAAGFSVYYICDVAREERADELVEEHFTPILNKMVEDGSLTSWGWSSHVVGGKYRKLQTMTAADHKTLMQARGAAIEALYADDNEAGEEFSEICGPHTDYLWNIVSET